MLAAQGIKRTELGREAFVDKVWEWKEKYGGTITTQMRRLGASCDWSREHFTLDDRLSGAIPIIISFASDCSVLYRSTNYWKPRIPCIWSSLAHWYSCSHVPKLQVRCWKRLFVCMRKALFIAVNIPWPMSISLLAYFWEDLEPVP